MVEIRDELQWRKELGIVTMLTDWPVEKIDIPRELFEEYFTKM
jgi:hypothetical protein